MSIWQSETEADNKRYERKGKTRKTGVIDENDDEKLAFSCDNERRILELI